MISLSCFLKGNLLFVLLVFSYQWFIIVEWFIFVFVEDLLVGVRVFVNFLSKVFRPFSLLA